MHHPTWLTTSVFSLLCCFFGFDHDALAQFANRSSQSATQAPILRFNSPLAKKFAVPRRLPLVDFEIEESYAGLLDLSQGPYEQLRLFFWFVPAQTARGARHLTLWSNGGPGCSSMIGAFQENGPMMLNQGWWKPTKNPYSWHERSSMIYLDHPAQVGFSEGNLVVNNEHQIADYTLRFLKAWLKVFPEMAGQNLYLAGESYAGMYLSYIAENIFAHELSLHLQGILLIDPVFANPMLQEQVPLYTFVEKHKDVFKFNATFMEKLRKTDYMCGYSQYLQKHLVYPPSGPFPRLNMTKDHDPQQPKPQCDISSLMINALPDEFELFNILKKNKKLEDPLNGDYTYFSYLAARKAFNVDPVGQWEKCLSGNNTLFPNDDQSAPPAYTVLPNVIRQSKRTVIVHGKLDARLYSEGTKLAIQNMTWQDLRGFQNPVNETFKIDGKVTGQYRSERGLTYVEVDKSGHMLPHDKPRVALHIFEYFLGQRGYLSS